MKARLIILLILILNLNAFSQSEKNVKQQAEIYAKAMVLKDYSELINFSHTAFINLIGGKEKALPIIKAGMEDLALKGIAIESVAIGEPKEIYTAGSELHCLVPMKTVSSVSGGKKILQTYLLAVSNDKGSKWSFINLTGGSLNNKTITNLIPNFNQDLILPEILPAEFVKN